MLSVATNAGRTSNVRPLDGAVFKSGASAYIFVGPLDISGVSSVEFSLDGDRFATDRRAPFDFAGTSRARPCGSCPGLAYPFESNLLSLGDHRVTALITRRDGSRVRLRATFTVARTRPHGLFVSSSPRRRGAKPLEGAELRGERYVFLGPAADSIAGARRVVFRIDGTVVNVDATAPYDAIGSYRNGGARPLDTRRMRRGRHEASATVELRGGAMIVYSDRFRVT